MLSLQPGFSFSCLNFSQLFRHQLDFMHLLDIAQTTDGETRKHACNALNKSKCMFRNRRWSLSMSYFYPHMNDMKVSQKSLIRSKSLFSIKFFLWQLWLMVTLLFYVWPPISVMFVSFCRGLTDKSFSRPFTGMQLHRNPPAVSNIF